MQYEATGQLVPCVNAHAVDAFKSSDKGCLWVENSQNIGLEVP